MIIPLDIGYICFIPGQGFSSRTLRNLVWKSCMCQWIITHIVFVRSLLTRYFRQNQVFQQFCCLNLSEVRKKGKFLGNIKKQNEYMDSLLYVPIASQFSLFLPLILSWLLPLCDFHYKYKLSTNLRRHHIKHDQLCCTQNVFKGFPPFLLGIKFCYIDSS